MDTNTDHFTPLALRLQGKKGKKVIFISSCGALFDIEKHLEHFYSPYTCCMKSWTLKEYEAACDDNEFFDEIN